MQAFYGHPPTRLAADSQCGVVRVDTADSPSAKPCPAPSPAGHWIPAVLRLSLYGRWRTSARKYSAAVRRYDDEIGRLNGPHPRTS